MLNVKHFSKPRYKNRNIANTNFLSDAETSLSCFCLWDIFNHLLFVLSRVWAFLSCFDIGGISAINHHGIYKESRNSHKTRKYQPEGVETVNFKQNFLRAEAFQMAFSTFIGAIWEWDNSERWKKAQLIITEFLKKFFLYSNWPKRTDKLRYRQSGLNRPRQLDIR